MGMQTVYNMLLNYWDLPGSASMTPLTCTFIKSDLFSYSQPFVYLFIYQIMIY